MMKPKRDEKERRRAGRFQGLLKVGTGLTLAVTLAMLSGCPFVPQPACTTNEDCADTPDTPLCLVDEANAANNACVACLTDADCPQGICAQGQGYVCVECIADADCDDGDLCTTDVCDAATCTFTPVECAEGEFCDPATGECVAIECEEDADCDDGVFCNGAETCADFLCVAGTDPCPDDGLYCNGTESCNEDTDACESSGDPCAEGETCDEATDTCAFEGCVEDADCDDANDCTDDVCDPTSAEADENGCVITFNTEPCDDGDACTEDDVCTEGVCVGDPIVCPPGQLCVDGECEEIECTSDADCDDGFSCTTDTCVLSTGECIYTPLDLRCDDGLFCTGDGGVCDPNDPDAADDGSGCVRPGNPCGGDTPVCNESTDTCVACETNADCDDDVACTDDECLPSGACDNDPNNASCDNDLYCDGVETCSPGCPDADDNGCLSPGTPCSNPTPVCDEDTETCKACADAADCDDDVPCTDDACNGVTGECFNTPNDANCDDAEFCDGVDFCDPGNPDADSAGCVGPGNPCGGGAPICDEGANECLACASNADCDDDVDCTVDTCNGVTGECFNTPDDGLCPGPGDPAGATACDPVDGCVVP